MTPLDADATSSVAAGVALVSSHGQSSSAFLHTVCQVMVTGGEICIRNSLQMPPPSLLLFMDSPQTSWREYLQDQAVVGAWAEE